MPTTEIWVRTVCTLTAAAVIFGGAVKNLLNYCSDSTLNTFMFAALLLISVGLVVVGLVDVSAETNRVIHVSPPTVRPGHASP